MESRKEEGQVNITFPIITWWLYRNYINPTSFQIVLKKIVRAAAAPPTTEGKKKRKFRAGTVALKVFCIVDLF